MLQVEDAKRLLVLFGNKASQVLKDLLCDLHKLKSVSCRAIMELHALFPPVHACKKQHPHT
jgi:hypothetical protein